MKIISNNSSVNVTEPFIKLKINADKGNLQKEVAFLIAHPPPKPIAPPNEPSEPISLDNLNNDEMSYGSGTTSSDEYRVEYQAPYDDAYELYEEALETYRARSDVQAYQQYQKNLQQKQDNLRLLEIDVTKRSVVLDPADVDKDGKLTTDTRKNLDRLRLSPADILEIEQSSRAAKKLTTLCSEYLNNPYLIDAERAFIITCQKQLMAAKTPIIDSVQSFNKSIETAKKMPIGAGEWMGRFLSKCADVVSALFSKTVPGQKAFSKTVPEQKAFSKTKEVFAKKNENQIERMQNFKNRLQKIIGELPKVKATETEDISARSRPPLTPT